jgi:hypothetical protein
MLFWGTAHWLGRQFQLNMPAVMQRFREGNTLTSQKRRLTLAREVPTLQYRERFIKPNPYLTQDKKLGREELPNESYWTGHEARPGMADLRPLILERDEYTCKLCGVRVTDRAAEVDHIRPVRRFKRPIDANVEWNLWTLCINCHQEKTEHDRQAESRVRGKSHARFGGGSGETYQEAARPAPTLRRSTRGWGGFSWLLP